MHHVARLALLLAAVIVPATHAAPPTAMPDDVRFPAVSGRNLEGREFALPRDFGDRSIAVVAFRQEQQRDVDTWLPALRELGREHPGLAVYELPTLATRYRLIRAFIDGGMARGIPDRAAREATITIYTDAGAFRRALAIPDDGAIHVLLVDRAGRILWRAAGRYDERAMAALAATVAGTTPGGTARP